MLNLVNTYTFLLFGGVIPCRHAKAIEMVVRVRDSGVLLRFTTVGWRIGRDTKSWILEPTIRINSKSKIRRRWNLIQLMSVFTLSGTCWIPLFTIETLPRVRIASAVIVLFLWIRTEQSVYDRRGIHTRCGQSFWGFTSFDPLLQRVKSRIRICPGASKTVIYAGCEK